MKDMSFVSLMNILISSIESDEDTTRKATQEDINKFIL